MTIHEYQNYGQYLEAQREAYERKKKSVWAQKVVINAVADREPTAKMVLCHGVRTGAEVKMFAERLPDATVIGTEIGEKPDDPKPYVVYEWDFQNVCDKWTGQFDIVYSNSLDHASDPWKAIETWVGQLKPGGLLAIEWAERVAGKRGFHDKKSKPSDPVSGTVDEIAAIVREHSRVVLITAIAHAKSDRCFVIYARKRT